MSSAYPVIWAMKHAPVADALERLVLIAMADAADDDGCNSYRSIRSHLLIATGVDKSTIIRRQRSMEARGLIRKDTTPPPARYLKIPADKRPTRWELCIPYSWWSAAQLEAIQREREDKDLPPLTPETRPDLPDAPEPKTRADKGKPNPKRGRKRKSADATESVPDQEKGERGVSQTPRESDGRGVSQTPGGVSHRHRAGCLTDTQPSPGDPPGVPSSPPAPPAPETPASHSGDGSGREDDDLQDDQTPASPSAGGATGAGEATGTLSDAEALVDDAVRRWGKAHRAPGARDRQRLAERVAAELETGGDERVILDELTRDLGDVRSAVGVVLGARTATPGWGRSADPRPDYSRYEPSGPRPVWCGVCDERTRHVAFERGDGSEGMRRCRRCHPARQGQDDVEQADGSRSSGEETSPPALVAKVADVDLDEVRRGGVDHGQDDGGETGKQHQAADDGEREGVDISEVLGGILGGDHQAADDGGEEASLPAAEASVAELRRRISVGGAAGEAAGRELSRRLLAAG